MAENAALAETWRKYRGWAARARSIRAGLDRWRLQVLCLTVAGAILATLASQLPTWFGAMGGMDAAGRVLSGASAAAMALAAFAGRSVLDPSTERQWLRARALGESCKSECYRFAARVPPYEADDAGARLLEKLQQLLAAGADVPTVAVGDEEGTKGLPPYPLPVADYIDRRIRDQVDGYYRLKEAENERKAELCMHWVQGLNAGAAILGVIGAIWGGGAVEAWVAVVGTVTAAVGAFALGQRFQRLAATYHVTADRLAVRLALWEVSKTARPDPGMDDPTADRALVMDAEAIMAAENEAWLAEFLKNPTGAEQARGKG